MQSNVNYHPRARSHKVENNYYLEIQVFALTIENDFSLSCKFSLKKHDIRKLIFYIATH